MKNEPDELLPLVEKILKSVGDNDNDAELERWDKTADGQKIIQFVIQTGKYSTNVGDGTNLNLMKMVFSSLRGHIYSLQPRDNSAIWFITIVV